MFRVTDVLKQGTIAPERNCSQENAVGFLLVKHSEGEAGGQKDTVGPREQHCPSYHLSKDAAD